jgi:division protein CdvB (Snf7/Vps24/ESCRT-III family)
METIKQKLSRMLMQNGMSGTQANEVIDLAIPKMNDVVEDYNIDFNESSDTYPEVIYTVLFMTVKQTALKWIEENVPMAWFKPMFI